MRRSSRMPMRCVASSARAYAASNIRGQTGENGHAGEGAQTVLKFTPVAELEATVGAAEAVAPLAINKDITSGRFAIGQFDGKRIERSRDMFVTYLKLKRSPAADELFTNALLPEVK